MQTTDPTESGCHTEADVKKMKNIAALTEAGLFGVLSSPGAYKLTSTVMERITGMPLADYAGCPNALGLLIHGLLYMVITRMMMNYEPKGCVRPYSSKDKWVFSAMAGSLFIMISSPFAYQLTESITSGLLNFDTSVGGCPNLSGLVLHSAAYGVAMRMLMR